jgi:hypothetical protein
LEGSVSSPNPDAREGHNYNSATVPYVESYYPKYHRDPRFNWDEQILVEQDKSLLRDPGRTNEGYEESVQETASKISLYHQLTLQAIANQIENREKILSMLAPDWRFQVQVY